MQYGIINYTTGEVVQIEDGDRVSIVKKNSIEYLKSLSEHEKTAKQKLEEKGFVYFVPSNKHVKVFTDEFVAVSDEISGGAVALLMLLIPYSKMGSNVLFSINNKTKIDFKYIIDNISPFGKNKTLDCLNELKKKLFIVEANDIGGKQYVMNPYIYFKGTYINKTILDLFSKYKRRT